MKRKLLHLGIIALLICNLQTIKPMQVLAADTNQTYSVKDFGASGSDKKDDTDAINQTLKNALTSTTPITVYIPSGTYYISDILKIYSNTTLQLADDATIIATDPSIGTMLKGYHLRDNGEICSPAEDCTHGGYSQISNITVQGGIWDRNSTGETFSTILRFNHGTNITIRDTTLKNCTDHFANLSGLNGLTVDNVKFSNAVSYSGTDKSFWDSFKVGDPARYYLIEAVHLDFCNAEGENVCFPMDNTAPQNITVSNCIFNNVFAGIGTHHINDSVVGSKININNNTFNNPVGYAINSYSYTDLAVDSNTVNGGLGLIRGKASTANVKNNQTNTCTQNVISFSDYSTVKATSNTITDTTDGSGIRADANTTLTANKNIITNAKVHGISCTANTTINASQNTINNCGESGFYIFENSEAHLDKNKINTPGATGIRGNKGSKLYATGNTITNAQNNGISIVDNYLYADGNTITGTVSNAICVENGANAEILNNTITSVGNIGVKISGNSTATVNNNTISKVTVHAINVKEDSELTANENTISNITKNAFQVSTNAKATITKNTIKDKAEVGIRVDNYSNATVTENTISNTTSHATYISNNSDATINNNQISNVSGGGILAKNTGTITANNNTISYAKATGISCTTNITLNADGNNINNITANGIYIYDKSIAHINNCTIDTVDTAGIRADGGSKIYLKKNTINSPKTHGISIATGSLSADGNKINNAGSNGIVVDSKCTGDILNNTISVTGGAGIKGANSSILTVKQNTISKTTSHGISATDSATLTATGNHVSDIMGNGIQATTSAKATLESNTLKNITGAGIRSTEKATVIARSNTLTGCKSTGINLSDSTSCTLEKNIITDSTKASIYLLNVTKGTINNNNTSSTSDHAIHVNTAVGNTSTITIKNNYATTKATTMYDIRLSNGCTKCIIENNILGSRGFSAGSTCTYTLSSASAKYTITYKLNGGTNNTKNPVSYTPSSSTITFANPTKSGYTFVGWYRDSAMTLPLPSIGTGSSGNITLYAKWRLNPLTLNSVTNTTNGMKITWKPVSTAQTYYIYRATTTDTTWKKIASVTGSTTSYTDASAASGTTYLYNVTASDGSLASDYATTSLKQIRLSNPTLKSASLSGSSAVITWDKVVGAKGYYLYRKYGTNNWVQIANLTGNTSVKYTDTDITTGTLYKYTVRAYNSSVKSDYDTTGIPFINLGKSAASTVTNSYEGITITWKRITGATGYYIYRKEAGGKWVKIQTIALGKTIEFTDKTAISGRKYYYTVRAYNGSFTSPYDTAGLSINYLKAPQNITVINTNDGLKISWEKVECATYYNIYKLDSKGTWVKLKKINSDTNTYTDTAVIAGQMYTYTVKAFTDTLVSGFNKGGVESIRLTTPILSALVKTKSGPQIRWEAVKGATGYYIYRKDPGSTKFLKISTVSGSDILKYTDKTAIIGKSYAYTVKAFNNAVISNHDTKGKTITY